MIDTTAQISDLREPYATFRNWVRFQLLPLAEQSGETTVPERLEKVLQQVFCDGNQLINKLTEDMVYIVLNHPPPNVGRVERHFVAAINWSNVDLRTKAWLSSYHPPSTPAGVQSKCKVVFLNPQPSDKKLEKVANTLWSNLWNEYWDITQNADKRDTWNHLLLKPRVQPLPMGLYWGDESSTDFCAAYFHLRKEVAKIICLSCLDGKNPIEELLAIKPTEIGALDASSLNLSELQPLRALCNAIDPEGNNVKNQTPPDAIAWMIFHLVRSYAVWGGNSFLSIPIVIGTAKMSHTAVLSICSKKPLKMEAFREWCVVADALLRPFVEEDMFSSVKQHVHLEKYRQMMELLQRPLVELSHSIDTMQRDAQELRAILYDPAQAIFESYQLLSDLFAERSYVQVSPFVRVMVSHNCDYSEQDEDAESNRLDGLVVWAFALCRIFGLQDRLKECRTKESVVMTARGLLEEIKHQKAFEQLHNDLLYLCDPKGLKKPKHLADSLTAEEAVTPFLQNLKKVAFKPFKLEEDEWHMLGLILALERYRHDDRQSMPAALTLPESCAEPHDVLSAVLDNSVTVLGSWTPIAYHVVLSFLLKAVAVAHKKGKLVRAIRMHLPHPQPTERDRFVIEVWFTGEYIDNQVSIQSPEGTAKLAIDGLWKLINERVLMSPRDWRLDATNVGDFRTPFVELASRVLGFVDNGSEQGGDKDVNGEGWQKERSQPSFSNDSVNSVCILSRANREFRLELGHRENDPGLRLSWVPRVSPQTTLTTNLQADGVNKSRMPNSMTEADSTPSRCSLPQASKLTIHVYDHEYDHDCQTWFKVINERIADLGTDAVFGRNTTSAYPDEVEVAALSSNTKCIVVLHTNDFVQKQKWVDAFSALEGKGHLLIVSGGGTARCPKGSGPRVHACEFNLRDRKNSNHFSNSERVTCFFTMLSELGEGDLNTLPWENLQKPRTGH